MYDAYISSRPIAALLADRASGRGSPKFLLARGAAARRLGDRTVTAFVTAGVAVAESADPFSSGPRRREAPEKLLEEAAELTALGRRKWLEQVGEDRHSRIEDPTRGLIAAVGRNDRPRACIVGSLPLEQAAKLELVEEPDCRGVAQSEDTAEFFDRCPLQKGGRRDQARWTFPSARSNLPDGRSHPICDRQREGSEEIGLPALPVHGTHFRPIPGGFLNWMSIATSDAGSR